MVSYFLAFVLCLSIGLVASDFSFKSCSKSDASVVMHSYNLPNIVQSGSRYEFGVDVEVKSPLKDCATVTTTFVKQHSVIPMPGCQDDLGKCTIPICNRPGFPMYNPLWYLCEKTNVTGRYTVPAGRTTIKQETYFPGLGGIEIWASKGDYVGDVVLKDESGKELGCWSLSYTLAPLDSKC